MNKVSLIFAFSLGAAAGAAVSWRLLKGKYEQIANEQIAEVKAKFTVPKETKKAKIKEKIIVEEAEVIAEDKQRYEELAATYTSVKNQAPDEKEDEEDMGKPYVIPPEEFDENGYKTVSLTYWADGILTDDDNTIVKDVDKLVGVDSLDHFGEYEDDSVFVRNDKNKTDYEILRDMRKFKDLKKPYFDPSDEVEE